MSLLPCKSHDLKVNQSDTYLPRYNIAGIWWYMTRRKLPPIDIRDMYTELTAYDREYIINKYGGCGLAIKLLIQGGEYEQALKKIEELERLIK